MQCTCLGYQIGLWSACFFFFFFFFHVGMSMYFYLNVNMYVDIIQVSKSAETLAKKKRGKKVAQVIHA